MSLFTPTIPQANDNLDFSQGQLLSNNAGLDTVFGIDHTLFSDATANKGFHMKVTFPVRTAPGSTAGHLVEYSKTVNANSELFFQRDGVATEIQMTSGAAGNVADGGGSTANWQSFLPGGLQIKGGRISAGALSGTITYTSSNLAAFPTATLQVQLTPFLQASTNTQITNVSATSFSWLQVGSTGALYWVAIGY